MAYARLKLENEKRNSKIFYGAAIPKEMLINTGSIIQHFLKSQPRRCSKLWCRLSGRLSLPCTLRAALRHAPLR